MRWELLGLTWKCFRSIIEMLTLFCLSSVVRILVNHLLDDVFLSKISVKTEQTELKLMHMDQAIRRIVRLLSSKTRQWKASTCSSVIEVWGYPGRGSSSVLTLLRLNSSVKFFGFIRKERSSASICTMSTWISLDAIPHNLHMLFCCVLSIFALIWLVLMALFCHYNHYHHYYYSY